MARKQIGSIAGARLYIDADGIRRAASALQVVPKDFKKRSQQSAAGALRQLAADASDIFHSQIRRPGEKGEGGDHGRQTGNFTFGAQSGTTTFSGNTFEVGKDIFGFGYPNIPQADSRTNYVWRALEFGLSGARHQPEAFFPESTGLFPRGTHKLPKRFYFTSKFPGSARLRFPSQGSRKGRQGQEILKSPPIIPDGFAGKHFIEGAWVKGLSRFEDRFQRDFIAATAAFGRKR